MNLGMPEMIFIFLLALVIFGPRKLPEIKGHPALARHVANGLVADEFDLSYFQAKGLDHGVFSPLSIMLSHEHGWPVAMVPLQVGVLEFPIPSAKRSADRTAQGELVKETGSKAAEGAATGAVGGGLLGGIVGFLVGVGALAIPGIGPVVSAGVLTTALGTAGATAVAGAGKRWFLMVF